MGCTVVLWQQVQTLWHTRRLLGTATAIPEICLIGWPLCRLGMKDYNHSELQCWGGVRIGGCFCFLPLLRGL